MVGRVREQSTEPWLLPLRPMNATCDVVCVQDDGQLVDSHKKLSPCVCVCVCVCLAMPQWLRGQSIKHCPQSAQS